REIKEMATFPGVSSAEILKQLESANVELGTLCWDMVRNNYDISIVVDKLLNALERSTLTLDSFRSNPAFRLVQAKSAAAELLNGFRGTKERIRYRPNFRP
ncbi:MAG: hypothetical protein PF495_16465, partial [Spirochaetales bacterium]|nr:hypothetical protein [Spirochaetales bacterium]